MKTGAIIAAAGVPLSMPDFDPTIMMGDTSVIKRIVISLQKADIEPIVVVTGYKADLLEKHIAHMGVVFLRNEDYMKSDMFHGVCTGLEYLKSECEDVFVMPVDVPLFSSESLNQLMGGSKSVVCPVFEGRKGHPVLIKNYLFDKILNYQGDCGLQGALDSIGCEVEYVDVEDEGILLELDSQEDFDRLLEEASKHREPLRYNLQLKIGRNELVFGSGILQFLELVNRTGSMQTACRQMHVSYSKGLKMIRLAEKETGFPLLERHAGGSEGGTSFLTSEGRNFIENYTSMKDELDKYAEKQFNKFFSDYIDKI